jgi:hypothetical protein
VLSGVFFLSFLESIYQVRLGHNHSLTKYNKEF